MYRFSVVSMVMLCAIVGWGCHAQPIAKTQNVEYAALQFQPDNTLSLRPRPIDEQQEEPSQDSPRIAVETIFVMGPLAELRHQGLISNENFQIVNSRHVDQLLRWAESVPSSAVIRTPRLVMYSGQSASCMIDKPISFVQDFNLKTNEHGQLVPEPILGQCSNGKMVDVRATLEGNEIVFDYIAPKIMQPLGIRECRAKVVTQAGQTPIRWEEPYILMSAPRPNEGVQVRVQSGQIVLLPLQYRIIQGSAANARGVAGGGMIVENYSNMIQVSENEPSPLNRQWLVMLKASVVGKEKRGYEW